MRCPRAPAALHRWENSWGQGVEGDNLHRPGSVPMQRLPEPLMAALTGTLGPACRRRAKFRAASAIDSASWSAWHVCCGCHRQVVAVPLLDAGKAYSGSCCMSQPYSRRPGAINACLQSSDVGTGGGVSSSRSTQVAGTWVSVVSAFNHGCNLQQHTHSTTSSRMASASVHSGSKWHADDLPTDRRGFCWLQGGDGGLIPCLRIARQRQRRHGGRWLGLIALDCSVCCSC